MLSLFLKKKNTELQYQGSQIEFSFSANPLTAFYVSSVGVKLQQTPQYRTSPQWSAWSGRKLIKSARNCLNPMCYTTYKVQCDLTAEVNDRCILIQEHFFCVTHELHLQLQPCFLYSTPSSPTPSLGAFFKFVSHSFGPWPCTSHTSPTVYSWMTIARETTSLPSSC